MKYLQRIMAMLCCLTLSLSLAACSGQKESLKGTDANSAKASASARVTKYPVTITDSESTKVTFSSEPRKVISLAPNITETIYQLGLEGKLVGRTDYCDYPKEVLNIESVGTLRSPDIEKIISLKPDVVIASTHFSDETYKKLTDLGIKVVVLYEEHDIEGVYSIIETMGTIFNVNETAATTVKNMKASIAETKIRIKGLKHPDVYYVVGFGEYGDYTAGGDTFISQMMTLAGGHNIAKDVSGWSYSLEKLVEADPDIIILPDDMKADFVKTKNYKDLTAVKKDRVYGIDKNLIERQGYRNAKGLRTLAKIIHPEAFQ